jgi:hypothetical protein
VTFQIGKFYKAGSKTKYFKPFQKTIVVDICESDGTICFYNSDSGARWESHENCTDFEEWREPREFTLLRNNLGYYEYTPELKLEPGETIKLREVL